MAELDPLDARLRAAVHRFADHADTTVDAAGVATRVGRPTRRHGLRWLATPIPVPAPLVVAAGLLIILFAWTVGAGGSRPQDSGVIPPAPVATASPAPPASALPGSQARVTGASRATVAALGDATVADGVTTIRGRELFLDDSTDDLRTRGTGSLVLDITLSADAGTATGALRLETQGGAWEGSCSGGAWNGGDDLDLACWLAGSGEHAGLTYYRHARMTGQVAALSGAIAPVAAPSR